MVMSRKDLDDLLVHDNVISLDKSNTTNTSVVKKEKKKKHRNQSNNKGMPS